MAEYRRASWCSLLTNRIDRLAPIDNDGHHLLADWKCISSDDFQSFFLSIYQQGTVERLMSHLLEDSSGDPSYVEDFLLTHRIFIDSPLIVCSQLLEW